MIDIGANLTNKAFKEDLPGVIDRARQTGLTHIIVTGTTVAESRLALELCSTFPDLLYCTAGVHPHDAKDVAADWIEALENLHRDKHVKAIGETGLDFNRNYSSPDIQLEIFHAQLSLACKLEKPVFVHDRDSAGETLRILKSYSQQLNGVVIHCFTGTKNELTNYLKAGFSIGITGWVCDERRGKLLQSLIPLIPDTKLMLETDAPWLIPRNLTTKPVIKNRCEPIHLTTIIEKVAQLRNQSIEEVRELTIRNARKFFSI